MRKKPFIRKKELYSDCSLHDSHGFLCNCSRQRANWYLQKDIATIICKSPLTVQLKFDPDITDKQREAARAVKKQSICCVCGERRMHQLTRHHIIPLCFRKHFPSHYKVSLGHDVLPLCHECHVIYNKSANEKTDKLFAENHSIFTQKQRTSFLKDILRLCKPLVERLKIPPQRLMELNAELERAWEKQCSPEDIATTCLRELAQQKPAPLIYLQDVASLDDFIRAWRRHFIATMNPQFMPQGWEISLHTKQIED